MSTHTPGPWEWNPETGRVDAVQFRKPTTLKDGKEYMQGLVALPYACGEGNNIDANSRLIAAAPDLLRALSALLERSSGEHWPVEQEMARAAIAKAVRAVRSEERDWRHEQIVAAIERIDATRALDAARASTSKARRGTR